LEIVIKNLEVSDILNLARVDSYFSSFLPNEVFYGEYMGYEMCNRDDEDDEEYSDEDADEDDGECYGYEGHERRPEGYEDDEQLQCRIEAAIEEDFNNMFPIQNGLNDLMI